MWIFLRGLYPTSNTSAPPPRTKVCSMNWNMYFPFPGTWFLFVKYSYYLKVSFSLWLYREVPPVVLSMSRLQIWREPKKQVLIEVFVHLLARTLVLVDSDALTCWFQHKSLQALTNASWENPPRSFWHSTANFGACISNKLVIIKNPQLFDTNV